MPIETGPHKGERGFWSEDHADWVTWDFIGRRLVSVGDWPRIREAFHAWYDRRFAGRPMAPMIISDDLKSGVNGLWHPATGARTDSKSHFRRMTRDTGCVEVGDDSNTGQRSQIDDPGADLARAFAEYGL